MSDNLEERRLVFWRFGASYAVAGFVLFIIGAMLFASFRRWIPLSPFRIYSVMTDAFAFLTIAGTIWNVAAALRGVGWDNRDSKHMLLYGGLPIAIIVCTLYLTFTHQIRDDIGFMAGGAGLIYAGRWAMSARPPFDD